MPRSGIDYCVDTLYSDLPAPMRWCGRLARLLRPHNIAVAGKTSGNATTDALTLADLAVQEILVSAVAEMLHIPRLCSVQAEETTGGLSGFDDTSPWVIGIDPIDGTRQYRDQLGDAYSVVVHLRTPDDVKLSLVYLPERGPDGTWLVVRDNELLYGPDSSRRRAADALSEIEPLRRAPTQSKKIYVVGFHERNAEVAREVTAAGLEGVDVDFMTGCVFELLAQGQFAGCLVHSPNVYDFPVALHIVRHFGGDAISVHDGRPIDFTRTWRDERANMLRLPGIVACTERLEHLTILHRLARDWSPKR